MVVAIAVSDVLEVIWHGLRDFLLMAWPAA
jgi:hypothetical protein